VKEGSILKRVLLTCSRGNTRLFRNNVGQYQDKAGNWIRYGVCNPGGSDLIGWQQVLIKPEHIGRTLAVFTAIEVKALHGKLTAEQTLFLNMVELAGGISGMARSAEEAERIVKVLTP